MSGSDYCFGCGKPVYECLSTFRCTFAERIEPDDTEKTNSIYLGSRDRTDCCDSTFLGIYLHFFLVRCIGGCMGPGCGYSDYIYSHEEKADFCGCKVSHSGQYSGSNESSLWGYCHIAGKSGEFRIAFGVFCLYEAFAPDGL